MSIAPGELDRLRRVALASLHEHWRFYLIEGIILIALGAAAIVVPPIATLTITIFLGWLLAISGLVGLLTTLRTRGVPGLCQGPGISHRTGRSRLAGVAGGEEGGEATRYRGDHEDRPCLKGDIHYPAASGQGVRDRR